MLILAGGWGVLFGRVDQSRLLGLDLDRLPTRVQANVMAQYRFLRAIELGFGLFAFRDGRCALGANPDAARQPRGARAR